MFNNANQASILVQNYRQTRYSVSVTEALEAERRECGKVLEKVMQRTKMTKQAWAE